MKFKSLFFLSIVTIFCTVALFFNVISTNAEKINFDVQPAGETYNEKGYFNFPSEPEQTTDLPVLIKNLSDKELILEIEKLNAITNIYGNITYTTEESLENSNLRDLNFAAAKYIDGPRTVTLHPSESKMVTFLFKNPIDVKEGTLLGGLSFTEKDTKSKSDKGSVTTFNRILGVQSNVSTEKIEVITQGPIEIVEETTSPYISVLLENKSPMIAEEVSIEYKVSNEDKEIFQGETTSFKMSPKSVVTYPINWASNTFQSGEYKITTTVTHKDGKFSEEFDFEIAEKNVEAYSEALNESVNVTPTVSNKSGLWFVGGVLATLFTVIVGLLIFRKKAKKKKTEEFYTNPIL